MDSIIEHRGWPHVNGPKRDRRGRFCSTSFVPAIWLDKVGMRENNRAIDKICFSRFMAACGAFEQLHGQRAVNDYRLSSPATGTPADVPHDAARVASRGGKENREGFLPRLAPSVVNARIGAFPL